MKIKYIIFSFVALFTFVGCFKDKGNYNYTKFPDLLVRIVSGTKTDIIQGESTKLVLEMQNVPEGYVSEYTYEWLNEKREVIHTGIEYIFEGTDVGSFRIGFRATDVKTGAIYASHKLLNVEPIFKKGFVILAEDGDNTDMHFVVASKIDGNAETFSNDSLIYDKEFVSIYKNVVKNSIVGKPLRITEHWLNEVSSPLGELSVETLVGNDRKIIEVNGSTMERETYIEQEFMDGAMPTNFKPKKIIQAPWDSYIINEDGRVFVRRSAANNGFHLGYYDGKVPLWGNKTYIENIFMTHYSECSLFLTIEKDPSTGKRNFVGLYEKTYSAGMSGLRMPQLSNSNPRYNDLQGEIIFDDYFKNEDDYGMNALITKNSSNELILDVLTYKSQRIEGVYYLNFIEQDDDTDPEDQLRNTINLTQEFGINSLKGMFTIKTLTDKIIYMYDDHNLYRYDYLNQTFKTVHSFSKVIAAAAGNSMLLRREYDFEKLEVKHISLAFGFEDGSFEVYELGLDMIKMIDKFDKLDKLVYQNKGNFGKIKQILFKIGEDLDGFTQPY